MGSKMRLVCERVVEEGKREKVRWRAKGFGKRRSAGEGWRCILEVYWAVKASMVVVICGK